MNAADGKRSGSLEASLYPLVDAWKRQSGSATSTAQHPTILPSSLGNGRRTERAALQAPQ